MRVAVDAMGGDHAPGEIVAGAVAAARTGRTQVVLVGDSKVINQLLGAYGTSSLTGLNVEHCSEVVGMDEAPALALRQKRDASILVATRMVKEGSADAVVSAGSTGAQMAAALLILGRVPGIHRPGIPAALPTIAGGSFLLLDVGANMDALPQDLLNYALMANHYAQLVLKVDQPRIGLLNVGSEAGKGSEPVKKAFELLEQCPVNFIGNIEARYLFEGLADVVVCDGFVGNNLLKLSEGLAGGLFRMIKNELGRRTLYKVGALMLKTAFKNVYQTLDYTEYGGLPLLGVNGVSIICHGSSNAKAVKNAILQAADIAASGLIDQISSSISNQ